MREMGRYLQKVAKTDIILAEMTGARAIVRMRTIQALVEVIPVMRLSFKTGRPIFGGRVLTLLGRS